jgi:REP element-mobilizing transposase RayT
MLTRRCAQRQFLLRPDEETCNAFLYCLAEAAAHCGIDIIMCCVMSNHHHTSLRDNFARRSEFLARFHGLFARCLNWLRDRVENVWATEEPNIVEITEGEALVDEIVYSALNPVKAGLVDRAHLWPGVSGYSDLMNNREVRVKRPAFFADDGTMPEEVVFRYTLPAELGDVEVLRAEVRRRVSAGEATYAELRARTGRTVVGRRAVLRQSWRDTPDTPAPRRARRPRFATRTKEALLAAVARYRAFVAAYRAARADWLAGLPAVFPAGTDWLRRFARIVVAPTPA